MTALRVALIFGSVDTYSSAALIVAAAFASSTAFIAAIAESRSVATVPLYRSTAIAAQPAVARRSAQCSMCWFLPHHSWITTIAGNGPSPAGSVT